MKHLILLGLVILAVAAEDLSLAETCDEEACKLPDCKCSSTLVPGGLQTRDVPQFVTLTFDDAVNVVNIETYRDILYNRVNFNKCPIGATFYVSHEYTNYQLLNELYSHGFEIALHSITHKTPQTWWASASYEELKEEIVDQREQISYFANIPLTAIQGVRLPFLQLSGNTSFQLLKDNNILYDCSWPTTNFNNPPLWPYTLDYASTQDCPIPPCPSASIPGQWVQPMVAWIDLDGFPCSMVDACAYVPDPAEDEDGWYKFILTNFERHYLHNRAPFPLYIHEGFMSAWPAVRAAYVRFLNLVTSLPDVYVVNSSDVINWIKNPLPVNEYRAQPCKTVTPASCTPQNCGTYTFNNVNYYLSMCNVCPSVYPWVGNPLGKPE